MKAKATILISLTFILNIAWSAFGQEGATVVPEIFLRSYDPVTVFFPEESKPKADAPADDPGKLLQIERIIPASIGGWMPKPYSSFRPCVGPPCANSR